MRRIYRWFNLGIDNKKLAGYEQLLNCNFLFLKDNITSLVPYSIFSIFIILFMTASRCITSGFTPANIIPFVLAASGFLMIIFFARHGVKREDSFIRSNIIIGAFVFIWYALAMYFDIYIQRNALAVMLILVFMAAPMLFDELPAVHIVAGLVFLGVMQILETIYCSSYIHLSDSINALLASSIGVTFSQKRTSMKLQKLIYTNMYETATKTSIMVAQMDIKSDKVTAFQIPDYIKPIVYPNMSVSEFIKNVGDMFIAEEFKTQYKEFTDLNTAAKRLGVDGQLDFVFKDFRDRWCQITLIEQSRNNNDSGNLVCIVQDIDKHKRKELEYQYKLSKALEEANKANIAKTDFLRRMSHDIRTPINGIRGMVELSRHFPDDPKKQDEYREKILVASGYLLSLVNHVLDMNKLESGEMVCENKPFDLISLLNEEVTMAEAQAAEHGLTLSGGKEKSNIKHRYIIGSADHLRRILSNLTGNAIKYNKENGNVEIYCREISGDDDNVTFKFICDDTGIGMSEEFQKHAFEPFAQEKKDARTNYTGTGLGLSIVRQMVEQMNGKIEFTSRENEGTRFEVTIPFKIDHNPVIEKSTEKNIDLRGLKALLAEDNELNMEIARFMLENEGIIVTEALNGKEAVDKFKASEPGYFDMIFMDIMMPVMNGLEATRHIRALERTDAKKIPIIAMSANAFQDDINQSLEAGMNMHLTKPIDENKLRQAVDEVVIKQKV